MPGMKKKGKSLKEHAEHLHPNFREVSPPWDRCSPTTRLCKNARKKPILGAVDHSCVSITSK